MAAAPGGPRGPGRHLRPRAGTGASSPAPIAQACLVGLAQHLDVHQAVADLDVAVLRREQVSSSLSFGSPLDASSASASRPPRAGARTPLPAGDDRGHDAGCYRTTAPAEPDPRSALEEHGQPVIAGLQAHSSVQRDLHHRESDARNDEDAPDQRSEPSQDQPPAPDRKNAPAIGCRPRSPLAPLVRLQQTHRGQDERDERDCSSHTSSTSLALSPRRTAQRPSAAI